MFSHDRIVKLVTLIFVIGLLEGCTSPPPPAVNIEPSAPLMTIQVGGTMPLAANVIGGGGTLTFKWTATGGSLTPTDSPAVTYMAPTLPGSYSVSVAVTGKGGTTVKSIMINVVAPPATPTPAPLPSATPVPTPTLAPTLTPAPTPHIVVGVGSPSSWKPSFCDDKCGGSNGRSSININLVPGRTNNAIEVSYDVKNAGYVVITKNINPKVLSGTAGMSFFYKGSGAPNTIEFKLMLRYPGDNDDTTYGITWNGATDTGDKWTLVEVPYTDFTCWWPGPNCQKHGDRLDLMMVLRMDFAISNKPDRGDMAGSGKVAFDDVLGLR